MKDLGTPLGRLKAALADPIACRSDSVPIYSVRCSDLAKALALVDAAKGMNVVSIYHGKIKCDQCGEEGNTEWTIPHTPDCDVTAFSAALAALTSNAPPPSDQ